MATEAGWHAQIVEQLSLFFRNEPDARAFVLTGSLTASEIQPDRWSDIDIESARQLCAARTNSR
jgi:hypothetical protein